MSKLSVNLVTWNGVKYISFLFESLRKQTFRDWEIVIIDNNSADGTVAAIQKELVNFPVPSRLIVNKENVGFAAGHNQAFGITNSEFVLIINQDLFLAKDCLEKLVNIIDHNFEAAVAAPRTMRWNFDEKKLSNIVDSMGLKVFRNRRVVEIGEGEEFVKPSPSQRESLPAGRQGQPARNASQGEAGGGEVSLIEVFGVSGAIALFRRRAIVKMGYFFDEDFNSYKEDVDLAYRLQSSGWKTFVVADAVAYHDRTAAGVGAYGHSPLRDDVRAVQNKSRQSEFVKYYSYKNHLATLYKNESWQNLLLDFPWILWYELKKFVYFLVFDRTVLRGLLDLWKLRAALKDERKKSVELRNASWKQIRKWWK